MEKLEFKVLKEDGLSNKTETQTPEVLYQGITMLKDQVYNGPTSIKYWM